MKFVRKILLPIVPIYYLISWLRNLSYAIGLKSSKYYSFPIICVGNLSTGGTGKSPMIEYLVRLLKDDYKIATLSRGYKRTTKGFQIADENSSASTVGDEPFQFYKKFNDITVSVDTNRQNGIAKLLQAQDVPEVILLDDAFQHRKVKAGLNILLTTYDKFYIDDIVLPTGNLREPRSGAKRAHIIIVTKCPFDLDETAKTSIVKRLKSHSTQEVFFSTIKYSDTIYSSKTSKPLPDLQKEKITLVTGIANPLPLLNYLDSKGYDYEHLRFKDHHAFKDNEIKLFNTKPVVLTTEKDYTRLKDCIDPNRLFYLPIEIEISEQEQLNNYVKNFVKNY